MNDPTADRIAFLIFQVSNAAQYRAALARLRVIENAPANSPMAQERARLELAVSRYLAMGQDLKR